jgi:tryptophanyl-tRNA synthetase
MGPGSVRFDPDEKPGVSNLLELLGLATGRSPQDVAASYEAYGPLKADTAAAIIELVRPIQERYAELSADPGAVEKVLRDGADKARSVASATYTRARNAMGLLPPA